MRNYLLKFFLVLWLITATFISMYAQESTISGRVTDSTGESIPGVSVQFKGTTVGTVTDMDGNFKMKKPEKSHILVFSFVGMESQEMDVRGKTALAVKMRNSNVNLQEVVAVGYGTVAKKDLTGAVAKVDMSEMQDAPVKSFEEALAGRVSGVQISSTDGQPGSAMNIVIRGGNSITQSNSPLYVIDGFPMESSDNLGINPADIESIDVLKDASATAIYGAEGANGVIIITTKAGIEGAPRITYDAYYGIQKITKEMDMLTPYQYVVYQNEIDPDETYSRWLKNGERDLDYYKDVKGIDWQNQIFRTAPYQNHYLNITGGNKKTKYTATISYFDQEGVLINSGFSRILGKLRLDQTVNDKLKVGLQFSYNRDKKYGTPPSVSSSSSASGYLMYSVWAYQPMSSDDDVNLLDQLVDPDTDTDNDYRFNPVLSAKNEIRDRFYDVINVNGYAEYELIKGLKYKFSGGLNNSLQKYEYFNGSQTRLGYENSSLGGPNGGVTHYEYRKWLVDNILTYDKKIKDHKFNVMAGLSMEDNSSSIFGAEALYVDDESLGIDALDLGTPTEITSSSSESTLKSFISRLNYNYKSKYYFTGTFRADGSSKFSKQNRWGYFPSASIAWRASEEQFLKPVKQISNLKVRLSWGITGNNRVDDFASSAQLGSDYYAFNDELSQAVYISQLENADLKWESTEQTDLGVDFGLLDSRINITADIYRKTTRDLLLDANLPATTGFDTAYKNIGSMRNQGLEFSLNTVNIDNPKFKWTSSFNISFNRNKVLALSNNEESMTSSVSWDYWWREVPAYIAKVGKPIGQIWGVIWDGVYQLDDFNEIGGNYVLKGNVPANGDTRSTIQPGYIKYKDLNGDGTVDSDDNVIIGNTQPKHTGGFSNTFEIGPFDLNFLLEWSYGNDVLNANRLIFESTSTYGRNQFATTADHWSVDNQDSKLHVPLGDGPNYYSTRVVEDGSYLRLKNIMVGYTFNKALLKKMKINSLRVYLKGQNLYTWTNYTGFDPDVNTRGTGLTKSFDYSAYPEAKLVTIGLKLVF